MTICENCGHVVVSRAKLGKGTQKGKQMPLNENRKLILGILKVKGPLSIRDIQREIISQKFPRVSKRNVGWNYHTIQADVSILLGGNFIRMSEVKEQIDTEGFHTNKIPKYEAI